ncbi:MAG: EamA family transporter [Proteobacteria bacterium]|nr:EamA family transporter [Pseudomonadota bacterium]
MSTYASAPPAAGRERLEGLSLLLLTACSWGLNWPIAKFMLTELPPFTMRLVCCAGGVVFAYLLVVLRGENIRVPRALWPRLVLFAMLNFGAFSALTTLCLAWLRASEAVIVTYTLPIWASLLAWPVLGERPTWRSVVALVLGLAGVAMLVGVDASAATAAKLPGVAMGLAAAVLFGLGTVLAKRHPLAVPPVTGVFWQVVVGLVPIVVLALFERPNWSLFTPTGAAAGLYVAVLPMTLSYVAWFRALRLLPASTAATGVLIAPIVGVCASAVMLGDPLGMRQLVALVVTLSGVTLAAWQPARRARR